MDNIISLLTFFYQFLQGPKIRCEGTSHKRYREGEKVRIQQGLTFVNDGSRTGIVKNIDVKVNGGEVKEKILRFSEQNRKKILPNGNPYDAPSDVPPIVVIKSNEPIYRFFEAIIIFKEEKITYHIEMEKEEGVIKLRQKPIKLKEHIHTKEENRNLKEDPESMVVLNDE